ncbi:MAG: VOC family protein [Pseudomonadota bacterium]
MAHGTIHWSECITSDVEGAKAHYAKVAGWTYDEMPMENGVYTVAKAGDQMVAGIMPTSSMPGPEVPSHWMTYIEVADINDAVANAGASGGTVLQPPFEVPGVGHITMVQEPGGAVVGFIQPTRG